MSQSPPSDFAVGDVILDRYRLDRFIASGSMGHVYEAHDTSLGRRVAIKFARISSELGHELEARLLLEARAAAKLRGRHVAHVFEIARDPSGMPFFVMEYLEGENLESVLQRRGRVSVGEAVNWGLQTCLALAEAHAIGIVHRDIKPENLFLAETPDEETVLKVLDFGASAFVATRWHTGASSSLHCGTPLYMSPERIEDANSCDLRSDVWALGAVIFELLIGHPPFDREGADVAEVIERTLTMEPASLHSLHPGVSPQLSKTILRCLDKDPSRRFQDVAALAHALCPAGRPGSIVFALRVSKIWERASKQADKPPQLVAEKPVPTPRPPMASEPLLLTEVSRTSSEPLLLTPATRIKSDN